MKVAITGHTNGIGAAVYTVFEKNGHTVDGYSISNGWDLAVPEKQDLFIDTIQANNYDCFINNAYPYRHTGRSSIAGFMQVELLNRVWQLWKNQEKTIVTIGSRSSDTVKNFYHPYSVHKKAIDDTCKQLRNICQWPNVFNVKPDYVDTRIVEKIDAKKVQPIDVAELIYFCVAHKLKIYEIGFSAR